MKYRDTEGLMNEYAVFSVLARECLVDEEVEKLEDCASKTLGSMAVICLSFLDSFSPSRSQSLFHERDISRH